MSNAPMDKGRVAVVAEKYQTNQRDQQSGQPVTKNRYINVGRATLWPSQQYSTAPNVEVELDALPIGHTGKLKLYIFWDSDNQNNQQQQQQQYQQVPQQQQYQQAQQQSQNQQRAPQPLGHGR